MSHLTCGSVSAAGCRRLTRLMLLAQQPPASAGFILGRQPARQFTQHKRLPRNMGVMFVTQQEAWVIERFGKFSRILKPGLNFCIPVVDRIAYIQSLKEIPINIPDQPAITVDNVTLQINGVLFLKVFDPYQASYGIEDAEFAMTQLAQTTMRSELGKISLDSVFRERDNLNRAIVEAINQASEPWGINCLRYEIRDIILPPKIKDAMQTQVEADRRKRAAILESEGVRNSDINVAEGKKQAQILASEAFQREVMNKALGESEAIRKLAEAKAQAIRVVSDALSQVNGPSVVSMTIAEKYIEAFGRLAKTTNTVLLPAQSGDVASMVAQALAIYKTVDSTGSGGAPRTPPSDGGTSGHQPSPMPPITGGSPSFSSSSPGTMPASTSSALADDVGADGGDLGGDFGSSGGVGGGSRAEQIERELAKPFGFFDSADDSQSDQQYQQQQNLYQQQQHLYQQQQQLYQQQNFQKRE